MKYENLFKCHSFKISSECNAVREKEPQRRKVTRRHRHRNSRRSKGIPRMHFARKPRAALAGPATRTGECAINRLIDVDATMQAVIDC